MPIQRTEQKETIKISCIYIFYAINPLLSFAFVSKAHSRIQIPRITIVV